MYIAGMLNSGSYHLNPLKLTIGLAKVAQENKVKIFENKFKNAIEFSSIFLRDLVSLASSYKAKEYLLAEVSENPLFLLKLLPFICKR